MNGKAARLAIQKAANADDLFSVLRSRDLSVSGRTEGRTTEQTEHWTICRLLATLASFDRFLYPLSVSHIDKPDFRLELDGRTVGIEITEAIPTDYARCLALAEREKPGALIDMSLFRWGDPPRTTEELRKVIQATELEGDGWAGKTAEKDWAHHIASVVGTKNAKVAAYAPAERQWLAIYDNLPLPNLHLVTGVELLQSLLTPWDKRVKFDAVFVEHGSLIVELTARSVSFLTLNDLWQ